MRLNLVSANLLLFYRNRLVLACDRRQLHIDFHLTPREGRCPLRTTGDMLFCTAFPLLAILANSCYDVASATA
jgi:hypothetical protein